MRTQALPLSPFEIFRTGDLTEAEVNVRSLLSPHRVKAIGRPGRTDVRYHFVEIRNIAVIYAQYGAAVRIDPGVLENFYLVGMPIAGRGLVTYGGREIESSARLASVQSCQQPVTSQWSADCRKITVKIGRAAFESHLASLLGRPIRTPLEFDLAFDQEQASGASWRHAIEFMLGELVPGSLVLSTPHIQRTLEEWLMTTLLFAHRSNYSDTLRADIRPTEPGYLKRAEEIIAADFTRKFSIHELAALSGSSVRSLQAGFRKHRGMTLTEFIRNQRLSKARMALLLPSWSDSVTDVALRFGYGHIGRFSRDYKARFGELPSRTLSRARR